MAFAPASWLTNSSGRFFENADHIGSVFFLLCGALTRASAFELIWGNAAMKSSLSIGAKLFLGFTVVLIALVALVLSSWQSLRQLREDDELNTHSYQVVAAIDGLMQAIIDVETGQRGFLVTGKESYLEPLKEGEKRIDTGLTRTKELSANNLETSALLKKLGYAYDEWHSSTIMMGVNTRRSMGDSANNRDVLAGIMEDGKSRVEAMRELVGKAKSGELKLLADRTAALARSEQRAITILIGSGVAAAALSLVVATVLARSIAVRLNRAVGLAGEVAAGNFRIEVEQGGGDEIGKLLAALAYMQQKLSAMIREIQQSARQINDASNHIAASSEQIALASSNQSSAAASMASSVQQMTTSIGQVSENAEHAQEVSQDAGRLSVESGRVIGEAVNGILRVADSVRAAADEVDSLGEQSKQISSVVSVIRDIADQTNLLALNAAIEAARAGESGRGFAVVADAVRKLAERTTSSTADISSMVQGIQSKTNAVVQLMQEEVARVSKDVARAHEAQNAVVSIQDSAERVVRMVNSITLALREQSNASISLASNVEQIAGMANDNARVVSTTRDGANQQNELAAELLRSVSQFQV